MGALGWLGRESTTCHREGYRAHIPPAPSLRPPLPLPPAGTKIYVDTAIVEGVRVFLIEPKNGYFDTQTVYGRTDDEVRGEGEEGGVGAFEDRPRSHRQTKNRLGGGSMYNTYVVHTPPSSRPPTPGSL